MEKLGDCCTYVTDKLFDCLLTPATVDIDEVQEDIYDDQGRIDHIAMALDAKGDAIVGVGASQSTFCVLSSILIVHPFVFQFLGKSRNDGILGSE